MSSSQQHETCTASDVVQVTSTTTTTTEQGSVVPSLVIAYVLLFFLGGFGGHRFYAGKFKSAIGMAALNLTAVLLAATVVGMVLAVPMWIAFGIWWIADAITMPRWNWNPVKTVVQSTTTTTAVNPEKPQNG